MLYKQVLPVCYLTTLQFHLGYQYTYELLLSLLYTTAHLWVPCLLKQIELVVIKMITTYNDITSLQNPCLYILIS